MADKDDTKDTTDTGDNDSGSDDDKKSDPKEFKPITSQEELDALIGRVVAQRTRKYVDYEDIKAKASKLDELENAKKTAEERAAELAKQAEAKNAEATNRLRKANLKAEVSYHASEANAIDLDVVLKLVAEVIEYDDKDEPINVDKVVAQILKEKPYLVKTSDKRFTGSADGGARGEEDRSKLTMDEVMKRRAAESRGSRF